MFFLRNNWSTIQSPKDTRKLCPTGDKICLLRSNSQSDRFLVELKLTVLDGWTIVIRESNNKRRLIQSDYKSTYILM